MRIAKRLGNLLTSVFLFICFTLIMIQIEILTGQAETDNSDLKQPTFKDELLLQFVKNYTINQTCEIADAKPWVLAENCLTSRSISNCDSKILACILHAMRTFQIIHADNAPRGTQLKLALTLRESQRVIFKPPRYEDNFLMVGTPYEGKDRPSPEIAAFHVSRLLGLYNTPLVVQRKIDLESHIRPVAHKNLLKTFFYEDGNTCFYGNCLYCKGPKYGVCGKGTSMTGALVLWLPDSFALGKNLPHPWRRTYREGKKAQWESDNDYCERVKETRPYETPPRLLDLISISVMDFITGNADRHHYESFEYSRDGIVVALDNGKSFGNFYSDEISILTPLIQCCMIRQSLYERLLQLDGILAVVLYHVLKSEPNFKIDAFHYIAAERRLETVINNVKKCIETHSRSDVLIDDGY